MTVALVQACDGTLSLASEQQGVLYGPAATGTRAAKDDKEKLSRLIDLVNERFGTLFDAQDIVGGVTQQLMDSEEIQRAAKANRRDGFDLVGAPAFDDALWTVTPSMPSSSTACSPTRSCSASFERGCSTTSMRG